MGWVVNGVDPIKGLLNDLDNVTSSKTFDELISNLVEVSIGLPIPDFDTVIKRLDDQVLLADDTESNSKPTEEVKNENKQSVASTPKKAAPDPNGGDGKKHGNDEHDKAINDKKKELEEKKFTDLRKNQKQVDADLDLAGDNRPDLGGINPETGKREYYEWDHNPNNSIKHGLKILENDPDAAVTLFTW